MNAPQVEISSGRISGRRDEGVETFLGIPFAAPPVGAARFRPPQPVAPWPGLRECTRKGFAAPQNALDAGALPGMDVGAQDEDCLTVNVYTPAADGGRRPVMVWIHGGAFVIGSGSQSIYDGRSLARRGDVVVVTIHYRLGAFGFLDLAERFGEEARGASNLGLRDQIAALDWVRENIAAFGGDPECVTIFGESAGGMSVGSLLASPAARGRFARAIPQSGAAHNAHDPEQAAKVLDRFLLELGVSDSDWKALREASTEQILAAQLQCTIATGELGVLLPFQPVHGDDVLPRAPLAAIREGNAAGVPTLVGTTENEWGLFAFMDPALAKLDDAGLLARAEARVGAEAAPLLAEAYRKQAPDASPARCFIALETDRVFRVPANRLADAQAARAPVWMYEFAWTSPAQGGALGACHALELPFVFDTLDKPGMAAFAGSGEAAGRVRDVVMDAWIAFARDANPCHPGLPEWPEHGSDTRSVQVLDVEPRLARAPRNDTLKAWEGLL